MYQLVALLNAFWSAIELGLCAATVSTLLIFNCTDGELILFVQLAHVILIALMDVKAAATPFASAM